MFDNPTLSDMKARPDLNDGESVIHTTGSKLGDVIRDNALVVLTTDRLLTGVKRGRDVDDEEQDRVGLNIALSEIDTLRRMGIVTKEVEVVSGDDVYELPPIQNDSDEIVDPLVERAGLEKTEWGDESTSKRTTKQLIAGILGLIGILSSGILVLVGIAGVLSLIGILFGIVSLFSGVCIGLGSWRLVEWGFSKQEEWISP